MGELDAALQSFNERSLTWDRADLVPVFSFGENDVRVASPLLAW